MSEKTKGNKSGKVSSKKVRERKWTQEEIVKDIKGDKND